MTNLYLFSRLSTRSSSSSSSSKRRSQDRISSVPPWPWQSSNLGYLEKINVSIPDGCKHVLSDILHRDASASRDRLRSCDFELFPFSYRLFCYDCTICVFLLSRSNIYTDIFYSNSETIITL